MFDRSIMRKMMGKFPRFGRIRPLHTFVSQETIKPSSPTPPHLKTHNLSLLDQFTAHMHLPIVFFYPNYNPTHTTTLKKSLSESLTRYYPFAGRFLPSHAPYIDCNDEGVEFLEASIDGRLDDFVHKKEQDETLDQLIPNGLGCNAHNTSPSLVAVQLNRFSGGGAAVSVSVSHKVADGFTMFKFFNHWATVSRGGSPENPTFVSSSMSESNVPGFSILDTTKLRYKRRRFMFQNSKLIELKKKVNAMGTTNPTRVESLTSLLFKCAVSAAVKKSGVLQPSNLFQTVNMRNHIVKNNPETVAGNLSTTVIAKMADSGEIKLNEVIDKLRKGRMELERLRDVREVAENLMTGFLGLMAGDHHRSRSYICSSLCRLPYYDVDFGWGKPVDVILRIPDVNDSCFLLSDTPSCDGIEALVRLQEDEMAIFQKDNQLLAYVEDI